MGKARAEDGVMMCASHACTFVANSTVSQRLAHTSNVAIEEVSVYGLPSCMHPGLAHISQLFVETAIRVLSLWNFAAVGQEFKPYRRIRACED
jgi:hypothetical protein